MMPGHQHNPCKWSIQGLVTESSLYFARSQLKARTAFLLSNVGPGIQGALNTEIYAGMRLDNVRGLQLSSTSSSTNPWDNPKLDQLKT